MNVGFIENKVNQHIRVANDGRKIFYKECQPGPCGLVISSPALEEDIRSRLRKYYVWNGLIWLVVLLLAFFPCPFLWQNTTILFGAWAVFLLVVWLCQRLTKEPLQQLTNNMESVSLPTDQLQPAAPVPAYLDVLMWFLLGVPALFFAVIAIGGAIWGVIANRHPRPLLLLLVGVPMLFVFVGMTRRQLRLVRDPGTGKWQWPPAAAIQEDAPQSQREHRLFIAAAAAVAAACVALSYWD